MHTHTEEHEQKKNPFYDFFSGRREPPLLVKVYNNALRSEDGVRKAVPWWQVGTTDLSYVRTLDHSFIHSCFPVVFFYSFIHSLIHSFIYRRNYGKIKKDSNFQNDIVSSFFGGAL